MPTYQYACRSCDHRFEAVQGFHESTLTTCPDCGREELRKLFGNVGVVFKGSGFYRNDSRSTKTNTGSATGKSGDGGGSGGETGGSGDSGGSSGSGDSGSSSGSGGSKGSEKSSSSSGTAKATKAPSKN